MHSERGAANAPFFVGKFVVIATPQSALPPACPERGGGCEQSEQTEGLNRGFAICPQPLSRLAATAPRPGSLLAFCNHHPKAVPVYGGFEPSAPSGRCSEGRIGRNREYCKRQRCKTTIFQPAFVAANVMSSRKGNGLEMLTAASYSPPQLRLRSAAPPQAVEPFGCPPTEKSPIGALFIACLFSLILISSRSRCSCRGRTGQRRGHSPRAGSCCRNSRGNSSRSSSRSRGRSPWGRCWSGTW